MIIDIIKAVQTAQDEIISECSSHPLHPIEELERGHKIAEKLRIYGVVKIEREYTRGQMPITPRFVDEEEHPKNTMTSERRLAPQKFSSSAHQIAYRRSEKASLLFTPICIDQ